MIDQEGTYIARAAEVLLGQSGIKETPFVEVLFKLTGDFAGETLRWTGWLTEKTAERTFKALYTCGWTGDNVAEFSDRKLHGIDANEVALVVEMKPYDGDNPNHQGKSFPEVRWVNRIGLNVDNAMAPATAASFGERMRAIANKARQKAEDFPHGANSKKGAPF